MADLDNVAGHKARFSDMKETLSPERLFPQYVGGGDVYLIGFFEKEVLLRHRPLDGASVVDIGCGIGRLTRFLKAEDIAHYLGTDVVPEVMAEAHAIAEGDQRFEFKLTKTCTIPAAATSVDLVCAFSVITHLLDEEIYDYFLEARRVLKPGGQFIVSYLDFSLPRHREQFLGYVRQPHMRKNDLLRFMERSTVMFFAEAAGFDVVELVLSGRPMEPKGQKIMPNGDPAPATFSGGQTVVWMQKRQPAE